MKKTLYLASSPKVEEITRKYFIKRRLEKSSKISYDRSIQKKLWKISENLTFISYGN